MISFLCPGCKKTLQTDDRSAGKTIICPHCKTTMRAPAAVPPDPFKQLPVGPPSLPRRNSPGKSWKPAVWVAGGLLLLGLIGITLQLAKKKPIDTSAAAGAVRVQGGDTSKGAAPSKAGGPGDKSGSALEHYRSALACRDKGNVAGALASLEKYFAGAAAEHLDPFLVYRELLGKQHPRAEVGPLLEKLVERLPASRAARLVLLLETAGDSLRPRLRAFITRSPDYLPAYRYLIDALPGDTILEKRERSLVLIDYEKRGGLARAKENYLDKDHADLKVLQALGGVSEPVDPTKHFRITPVKQPDFDGLAFVFDEPRRAQALVLTFANGHVAELPLDEQGTALVELRDGNPDQVRFKKRSGSDTRPCKHCGYLDGGKGAMTFSVEYVDVRGNRFTFPRPVAWGGTRFKVEVLHGAAAVRQGNQRPPLLQATCGEFLRACEVAAGEEGPFARLTRLDSLSTVFEIELGKVPGYDGKPGQRTFWLRWETDTGKRIGPEAVTVDCPEKPGDAKGAGDR